MLIDFRARLPLKEQFPNTKLKDIKAPFYMSRYMDLYAIAPEADIGVEALLSSMEANDISKTVIQAEWEFGDYKALNQAVKGSQTLTQTGSLASAPSIRKRAATWQTKWKNG